MPGNGLYYGEIIQRRHRVLIRCPFQKNSRWSPQPKCQDYPQRSKHLARDFLPNNLAFQPFEGYPEDIGRIQQVLRDADAGKRIRLTFFGASHAGDFWTDKSAGFSMVATSDMGLS